jgi:hypothetical protein
VDCWKLSRERQLAGKEHDIFLLSQQKGNSMDEVRFFNVFLFAPQHAC